mgnify:CR=1 FL=1
MPNARWLGKAEPGTAAVDERKGREKKKWRVRADDRASGKRCTFHRAAEHAEAKRIADQINEGRFPPPGPQPEPDWATPTTEAQARTLRAIQRMNLNINFNRQWDRETKESLSAHIRPDGSISSTYRLAFDVCWLLAYSTPAREDLVEVLPIIIEALDDEILVEVGRIECGMSKRSKERLEWILNQLWRAGLQEAKALVERGAKEGENEEIWK